MGRTLGTLHDSAIIAINIERHLSKVQLYIGHAYKHATHCLPGI